MPTINEAKKLILEDVLRQGVAKVTVATSTPGVQLPAYVLSRPIIQLNLSWKFGSMELRDHGGVYAMLSFSKQKIPVVLPWESIQAVMDCQENVFVFDPNVMPSLEGMLVLSRDEPGICNKPPEPFKPEVIVDNTEALGLGELQLTPPRTGHLRLLN